MSKIAIPWAAAFTRLGLFFEAAIKRFCPLSVLFISDSGTETLVRFGNTGGYYITSCSSLEEAIDNIRAGALANGTVYSSIDGSPAQPAKPTQPRIDMIVIDIISGLTPVNRSRITIADFMGEVGTLGYTGCVISREETTGKFSCLTCSETEPCQSAKEMNKALSATPV